MAGKENNIIQFPFRGRPRALEVVPEPADVPPVEPRTRPVIAVQPTDAPLIFGPTGVREAFPDEVAQFGHRFYEDIPAQHES